MAITRAQQARQLYRVGGASGREYGADTAASRSVKSSPSRNTVSGGDGGGDRITSTVKDVVKEVAPFVIGGPFGVLSRSDKARKALDVINLIRGIGKVAFPEGNLQKIKEESPDQRTYNIEATKDMVENLPGGLLKDILAPAGALVMSPFYDAGQAFDRMKPGSGITGFAKALDAENPISSAVERFTGAAAPLAERFEEGGPVGGIMDLETGRQMYFLGKLVKKATRAVKKIAKSPIGKAALLYVGAGGLGNIAAGKTFFGGQGIGGLFRPTQFLSNVPKIFSGSGLQNIAARARLGELSATADGGQIFTKNTLGKILTSPTALITGASAVAGALTPEEEQEAQTLVDNTGIDIEEARNSILAARREQYAMDVRARGFKADGGRIEYQEGSKEPVAKKTMPLLDMGGMEKDYREDGGFVPIGRMERADDVPARLSKNEFVFTADAVRNAGDGDIDKGAEVMYNMMKNLEAGGEVSEESQGLEGARKMFQTSQRLGEVI